MARGIHSTGSTRGRRRVESDRIKSGFLDKTIGPVVPWRRMADWQDRIACGDLRVDDNKGQIRL